MINSTRITFNVCGRVYETYEKTLNRFPNTLLGNTSQLKKYFRSNDRNEYYINKYPVIFENILFFYQSKGRLICPQEISMSLFEEECNYFKIPHDYIRMMKEKSGYIEIQEESYARHRLFQVIWKTLEYPETSKLSVAYSLLTNVSTLVSILVICIQSFERNYPVYADENWFVFLLDVITTLWFTFDVTLRIIVSPSIQYVLQSPSIYVDVLASYPYLLIITLTNFKIEIISFFRIFRILRALKLYRLFTTTKKANLFIAIFYDILPEFCLLLLCLLIVVFLGGSIIYFTESIQADTLFISIPESTWWALQTVFLIGYGDVVPVTSKGKLLAASYMIFGATALALPVLAVASKFIDKYHKNIETGKIK